MQAICVTASRELEVRDIPRPSTAAPGHVLIEMQASAINHGDKSFLKMPPPAGTAAVVPRHDVWGASGAGIVTAVGAGVPAAYAGKQVAVYRSLGRSADSLGLWSETAQMPYRNCLILPDQVQARDYSGSLVNVMTAYAFVQQIIAEGHQGVIATAGSSATAYALAALAKRQGVALIMLVRSEAAKLELQQLGIGPVIAAHDGFADELAGLAAKLNTTAVFDGVGGELMSAVLPALPINSCVYCYGFMDRSKPLSFPSTLLMLKNLSICRFSNYATATVTDPVQLQAALTALQAVIEDPMFRTRLGPSFAFSEIEAAMAFESAQGCKAILGA